MKLRSFFYRESEVPQGLVFAKTKAVYRLNSVTNRLEKTDQVIDIQELVNSCKDMALDSLLDRFLPQSEMSDEVMQFDDLYDDLDLLQESHSRACYWRDYFALPDETPDSEVFDLMRKKRDDLWSRLNKNSHKGGNDNAENSVVKEGEQSQLSSDSAQGK